MLIGFGGGLFAVGTLIAAMDLQHDDRTGLALGAWGAVQATGGGARDGAGRRAARRRRRAGRLAPAQRHGDRSEAGYSVVYHLEILLLFATLVALGPLVRHARAHVPVSTASPFGLAEFPR